MHLFVVQFDDDPQAFGLRQERMAEHLAYLQRHHQAILVAGSLRVMLNEPPHGACWIIRAEDRTEVETLVTGDPFYRHGLRLRYQVSYWSKAFDLPCML